jgi:hypothetical protein
MYREATRTTDVHNSEKKNGLREIGENLPETVFFISF